MNERQLMIFTTLAENLNFTKTADQLYLSQTTVTLQIRGLEEELGVKLFDRTSRTVHLTYAGEVFRENAIRILTSFQEARRQTTDAALGYTGQVKIGFADDVNATGIADFLHEFALAHPMIRLNLNGGYPEQLHTALLAGKYDMIFTPSFRKLRDARLERLVLGTYHNVAAFHKHHRFHEKQLLQFTDFEGENYIYLSGEEEDLDFSSDFAHALQIRGIHYHLIHRTDNIDAAFLMMDAEMGVTVLPSYFTGRFSGSSNIRTCPLESGLKPTEFLAVWRPEKPAEQLHLFLDFLFRYFSAKETG